MKRLLVLLLLILTLPGCGGGAVSPAGPGGSPAAAPPPAATLVPPAPPPLPDAALTRGEVSLSEARSLVLEAGWNLVSFPVAEVTSVTPGADLHPTLFAYDAGAGTYRAVPFTPEAVNADGGPGRGFWALATRSTALGYEGSGTPASADLAAGWNLVGLPAALAGELEVAAGTDPREGLTASACAEVPGPAGCLLHRSAFGYEPAGSYLSCDLGSPDTAFPGGRGYWVFAHSPSTLHFPGKHLVGLDVEPWTWSVPVGTEQAWRAIARFDDGSSRDVSAEAAWSSTHPALASVDGAGRVRAHAVGRAEIRAEWGSYSGSGVAFASDARPVRVEVSPANPTFPAGIETAFTATAVYTDGSGRDVTFEAEWRCADNFISFSYGPDEARVYYPGTTTVSATWDGLTGSTPVTVTEAVPETLTVTTERVPAGYEVQFGARLDYTNYLEQNVTSLATWTSSDPSVLEMSSTTPGLARGVAAGTALVTVAHAGLTREVSVSVSAAPLLRLQVSPDPASVAAGGTRALKATAIFQDCRADATERATWSVASESVAQVSNAPGTRGLLGGVEPGSTTVQAALGGVTGSAAVQVTAATVASIAIEAPAPSLPVGANLPLKAMATMSDGRTTDLTETLEWTITAGHGHATVGNATGGRGLLTAISQGSVTVRARQGSSGLAGTLALEVLGASVQELRVTPASLEIAGGASQALTAQAVLDDGSARDFTPFVSWAVDPTWIGSMTSGATFRAKPPSNTGQIRASWNGIEARVPVTVTATEVKSLQVTGDEYQLVAGSHRQLACTGTFTSSYSSVVTESVSWVSDDPAVARVSTEPGSRGLVLGVAPGQTTVRALDPLTGVSGALAVTVRPEAVAALEVTPADRWIRFGRSERMKALGVLPNTLKVDLTRAVTWSSDAPEVVAVSNGAGTEGSASARDLGAATLQAHHVDLGLSDSATVRVVAFEQAEKVPVNEAVAVLGDPTGTLVYVLDRRDQVLRVLEVASRRELARVDVGSAPADMVMTPDGRSLFVAAEGSGAITRVSLPSLQTSRFPVTAGLRPRFVALGSRNRLFVVSAAYPSPYELAAYDRDTGVRGEVILTGNASQVPEGLHSSPALERLFVTGFAYRLSFYDTSGATATQVGTTMTSVYQPHALSPDGALFGWFHNSPHYAAIRSALDFSTVANLDFGNRYVEELAFGADSDWVFAATGELRIDLGSVSTGQAQTTIEVVPPAGSARRVLAGLDPLPGGRTLVARTETFWNLSPREAELWFFTIRK